MSQETINPVDSASYIAGMEDTLTILITHSAHILNELAPSKVEILPPEMVSHLETKLYALMEAIDQVRNAIKAVKTAASQER